MGGHCLAGTSAVSPDTEQGGTPLHSHITYPTPTVPVRGGSSGGRRENYHLC